MKDTELALYRKYRPRSLKGVLGQDGAVASLQRLIDKDKVPHAIMLTGASGCGKTTIARILKQHLQCGDSDFVEINAADTKGVDTVRDIRRQCNLRPIAGLSRVWLIDEAHKLTNDAQNALLKIMEDTPKHAYFMLATTDPHKIIRTIHTRCAEIKLAEMSSKAIEQVVRRVMEREKMDCSDEVVAEIVEASAGSARKALVLLEQVGWLESNEEQIKAVQATSASKDQAILLARALINPRVSWPEVAAILKELKDDPEGLRYLVLGYCRSVLLGGGGLAPRAYMIIDIFSGNFYDSKHAGLAAACWEVVNAR